MSLHWYKHLCLHYQSCVYLLSWRLHLKWHWHSLETFESPNKPNLPYINLVGTIRERVRFRNSWVIFWVRFLPAYGISTLQVVFPSFAFGLLAKNFSGRPFRGLRTPAMWTGSWFIRSLWFSLGSIWSHSLLFLLGPPRVRSLWVRNWKKLVVHTLWITGLLWSRYI